MRKIIIKATRVFLKINKKRFSLLHDVTTEQNINTKLIIIIITDK